MRVDCLQFAAGCFLLLSSLSLSSLAQNVGAQRNGVARPRAFKPVAARAARLTGSQLQTWGKYKSNRKRSPAEAEDVGGGDGGGGGTPTEQTNPGYSPIPPISGSIIKQSIQTQIKVSLAHSHVCRSTSAERCDRTT